MLEAMPQKCQFFRNKWRTSVKIALYPGFVEQFALQVDEIDDLSRQPRKRDSARKKQGIARTAFFQI